MATDIIARGLAAKASAQLAVQSVANGTYMPNGAATNSANQNAARSIVYLPKGSRSLIITFAGFRIASTVETDLTLASPVNVSATVIPNKWNSSTSYAIGDQVFWEPTQSNSGSPYYQAAAANVNSRPSPSNTDWTSIAGPTPITCTTNGQPALGAVTVTKADGTTVTSGYFDTDPVPLIGADGPCYVEIRIWIKTGGGLALTTGQPYASGSSFATAVTQADQTTGGFPSTPSNGFNNTVRPALVRGIPAIADGGKCIAVIGHSIPSGASGGQGVSSGTITTGGSGYTTADIGKHLVIGNATGGTYSMAVAAVFIIAGISGGAVSSIRLVSTGSYATSGVPTGVAQAVTPQNAGIDTTVGTGLTITPAFGSTVFDDGNDKLAQGAMARGLSGAGLRYALFTTPSDTLAGWISRSYSRQALIAKINGTSAILDIFINDITGGASFATLQANTLLLARRLIGYGIKNIFLATVLPYATSTDGGSTQGNQTVAGTDAVRQSLNAWFRSVPAPFAGCIDQAAAIETGGASAPTGKYITNGTIGYVFIDDKHPTPLIIPTLAAAITVQASKLL